MNYLSGGVTVVYDFHSLGVTTTHVYLHTNQITCIIGHVAHQMYYTLYLLSEIIKWTNGVSNLGIRSPPHGTPLIVFVSLKHLAVLPFIISDSKYSV